VIQLVFVRNLSNLHHECTLNNSIVLAICVPKIIKFGADLTKFWQKQVRSFFLAHPVHCKKHSKPSKEQQTNEPVWKMAIAIVV